MDPRWLPWCWAAGAVGCGVLFFGVLPCRGEFRRGLRLVIQHPAAWLLPAGLVLLDEVMSRVGVGPGPGGAGGWSLTGGAGAVAGVGGGQGFAGDLAGGLRRGLQGWTLGAGAGILGALLVIFDIAGIRQGLMKGVRSVMAGGLEKGRGGKKGASAAVEEGQALGRVAVGMMVVGFVALVADAGLRGRGVPPVWHGAVRALAIPLTGWVSASVLGGLLLLMETVCRAPEKVAEVRWMESAAAHGVRLWPWAVAHGIGAWARGWVPVELALYADILLAAVVVGVAFAPMVFLHVKRREEAGAGLRTAMGFWSAKAWQPLAWAAGAGVLTALWFWVGQGLGGVARQAPWWVGIGLAGLAAAGHIVLTVLSLGAWVALRLADHPLPARAKRTRKSSTP